MVTFNPFGATTYNLGTSIGSTDTTILLSSFLEPVTGTPYTMALLNTDIVFATIAPKTSSSEFISFTGITQNANGTATLTGVLRGLAKKYPFTTDAAYKLPHSGQSQFIISDAPQVFNELVNVLQTGNVVAPASSTNNAITRFDSTTGKLLKNSIIILNDNDVNNNTIIEPISHIVTPYNILIRGGATDNNVDAGGVGLIGASAGGNAVGGQTSITGGTGSGTQAGGLSIVLGGTAGITGAGGQATVRGGIGGATSGAGGAANLTGGNATAGDSNGGNVIISPGAKTGAGNDGNIFLKKNAGSTVSAILDLSLIASTNKTFTFPNNSGTFALTGGTVSAFSTTQVFNGTPPSSFTDLDLSAVIGVSQHMVMLKITKTGAGSSTQRIDVKRKGDTGTPSTSSSRGGTSTTGAITDGSTEFVIIDTDTNGVIQWICSDTNDSINIRVESYW